MSRHRCNSTRPTCPLWTSRRRGPGSQLCKRLVCETATPACGTTPSYIARPADSSPSNIITLRRQLVQSPRRYADPAFGAMNSRVRAGAYRDAGARHRVSHSTPLGISRAKIGAQDRVHRRSRARSHVSGVFARARSRTSASTSSSALRQQTPENSSDAPPRETNSSRSAPAPVRCAVRHDPPAATTARIATSLIRAMSRQHITIARRCCPARRPPRAAVSCGQ